MDRLNVLAKLCFAGLEPWLAQRRPLLRAQSSGRAGSRPASLIGRGTGRGWRIGLVPRVRPHADHGPSPRRTRPQRQTLTPASSGPTWRRWRAPVNQSELFQYASLGRHDAAAYEFSRPWVVAIDRPGRFGRGGSGFLGEYGCYLAHDAPKLGASLPRLTRA
jgi:hypothetical protein